jgi:hypothetical protein
LPRIPSYDYRTCRRQRLGSNKKFRRRQGELVKFLTAPAAASTIREKHMEQGGGP